VTALSGFFPYFKPDAFRIGDLLLFTSCQLSFRTLAWFEPNFFSPYPDLCLLRFSQKIYGEPAQENLSERWHQCQGLGSTGDTNDDTNSTA